MSKKIRVAVNGAGRIGRAFIKIANQTPEIEIVAINDLGDIKNIAYLMRYDSVYGKSPFEISVKSDGKAILLDGKEISFLSEKEPANLPWKELDIDVVVESTGFFVTYEKSKAHLDAGAKRVVVTAPMKDDPIAGIEGATVLMGVNEERLKTCSISSNASCTTNASSPLIAILDEGIGIEKAVLNTVHGYTATQSLVDGPSRKGFREGRAAAHNIIPSTTGAAIAVTKAFTKLDKLFDGISMRVPVIAGSIADVTFIAKRDTTVEEVNSILKKAAGEERWKGIFAVTEEEIVSSDILGSQYGSIADLGFTRVVGGNLVKVLAWYDNEMGYTHTLVDHVVKTGSFV
ncbi:MAG: type I glyceraldehyde-3-phosphate dehydrogenase [Candidatus Zambryskibacteria bacterium CG_4_9_14_3_um_filter_40_16]|uniref:Type I glyceraldehyde-3-phosphate dehydrogenase n=2 Tax=Candidatus Zambryskiibacteriota TaxID=1817925 RepID=A0A2H0K6U4_9BACT|nr:MAG: type I glyceraldehyde-3-phosphate dehydrogenase [Candidatus Zambryskibacteria bacterium CG11_big_fil_rev_8_21_14_0_20_40_24]PJA33421.1 MAG: type I glyceraldehyde-3-phosphate dehydrogenase [Candidatus Zambryskibacteria bacterium CG_4_9_14_3_um_filter_40_16]